LFNEIYQWFLALNNRRASGGMGVSPVLFTEMQAYFSLIQVIPLPWEVQVLSAFDNTVLSIYQEQQEREQKKSQGK
jgi:hypothetical protein